MEKDNKNIQSASTVDELLSAIKDGFASAQKDFDKLKQKVKLIDIGMDMIKFDLRMFGYSLKGFNDKFSLSADKDESGNKTVVVNQPINVDNRISFLENKIGAIETAIGEIRLALGLERDI